LLNTISSARRGVDLVQDGAHRADLALGVGRARIDHVHQVVGGGGHLQRALERLDEPCGRRRTNPTVSVRSTGSPPGRARRRVVGSSVANRRSSTSTPAAVSVLSSVDLPALV